MTTPTPLPPTDPATAIFLFWEIAVFVFLGGLFFGSFFNVCIYRLPMGLSVNRPKRSFCYRCGTTIRWYDNIPILSWLLLGGKCRQCDAAISIRYPFIELLTGILFLTIFLSFNSPGERLHFATLWYLIFASLLLIATFTDIDHWIIPDEVTIGGTVAAVVFAALIGVIDLKILGHWPLLSLAGPFPALLEAVKNDFYWATVVVVMGPSQTVLTPADAAWWGPLANSLLGAAGGFGLLYGIGAVAKIAFQKEAMGFGDVKLLALIGATLGLGGSVLTILLACFIGIFFAGVLWLVSRFSPPSDDVLQRGPAELGPAAEVGIAPADPGEPEEEVSEAEEPTAAPYDPVGKLLLIAENSPTPRRFHHLPFGPSIAMAALIILIFHRQTHSFVAWLFGITPT